MSKSAVFLNGPIGVGKTTLGRCLSERLAGAFIDGDDYADTSKAWYCSIKQTSQAIVRNGLVAFGTTPVVVIAYPLTCSTWIYHRRKFSDAGVQTFFISLTASYENIIQPSRGREFTDEEHSRILTMIHEGYGSRPFSDLIFHTDKGNFAESSTLLAEAVRTLIGENRC